MARRMIRARRASPYLLYLVIAFSVLTVACAIGWGWTYSKKNQAELNVFGQQRLEAAVDMEETWQGLMDRYRDDGGTLVDIIEKKTELANAYRAEVQRLTERLMGDPFSAQHGEQLRQSVSDVLKATNDILVQTEQVIQESFAVGGDAATADVKTSSTQAAIRSLVQRIKALVLQVRQDGAAIANLQTQIKGLQDELEAAKAQHAQQVAQLNSNLQDEKNRLTTARDSAVQQSEQFKQEMDRTQDRLIVERRQAATEREQLTRQILTLQNNLKDLAEVIAEYRKVPTETGVDGRIVNIAEQGAVAYADLGKKDGVLLGMTFSIFAPSELGKTTPQPKAQCRIVKIMDNACELRIYLLLSDNPVVTGDVLHNPVYDRQRRMRFVLVGKMDIDGDGVDDAEQLKALIQEFGGRIDPALTVQADFLVVGEEPAVVAPPAADASPMERQVYEDARKRFIEYTEAKARAENFSIPVLSLNRFLGLVGIAGQS